MQDPDATQRGDFGRDDAPARAVPLDPAESLGFAPEAPAASAPAPAADEAIPVAPSPAADAAPGEDPAERLREERLTSLFESAVYGPDDERIGKVGQVYIDDQTQEPNWVTVKMGLFGTKEYFLPLDEAVLSGRKLIVPYSRDLVASAPGAEIDQNLSPSEEDALYEYYRVPGRAASQPGAVVGQASGVLSTGDAPGEPAVAAVEPAPMHGPGGDAPTQAMPMPAAPAAQPLPDEPAPTGVLPAQAEAASGPGVGTAADAGFTAAIRSEHGSSDEPRPADGDTGLSLAGLFGDDDEERELGTPRVHDESRGGTLDGEGWPREDAGDAHAIREDFAEREEAARRDDDGVLDFDRFRRPEDGR